MKVKIRLDTMSDVKHLVHVACNVEEDVVIYDAAGLRVNAKSMLGALYAMEFNEVWCESNADIYKELEPLVILE